MEYMHGSVMRAGDTMTGELHFVTSKGVRSTGDLYLHGNTGKLVLGYPNGVDTGVVINDSVVFFPVQKTTVAAPTGSLGGMFFDTTKAKMQVCNDGTNWVNMDGS